MADVLPDGKGALGSAMSTTGETEIQTITLATGLNGSRPTIAPLMTLGEPGNVVIG